MREGHLRMTAGYVLKNKVSRSKRGGDRVLQWAKKVERDMDRAIRRIVRLSVLFLDDNDNVAKYNFCSDTNMSFQYFSKHSCIFS